MEDKLLNKGNSEEKIGVSSNYIKPTRYKTQPLIYLNPMFHLLQITYEKRKTVQRWAVYLTTLQEV